MGRRVTMKDVATAAGVSYQTVSNVLNAPEKVRGDTRDRVLQAIARLDYQPHAGARELRERLTRTIAYVAPSPIFGAVAPVLDEFLLHLGGAAQRHDQRILLVSDLPGASAVDQLVDLVASGSAAGTVLSQTSEADSRVCELLAGRVPVVTFGRTDVAGHDWVDVDGAAGSRAAVEHLVARGRRRLAFIGFEQPSQTGRHRREGFLVGCQRAGLAAAVTAEIPDAVDRSVALTTTWLESPDPPDAVVTASDTLAAGVVQAAGACGVTVGAAADLSVTGYDDSPVAPLLSPTLTSLSQPLEAVATQLIDLLVNRLSDPTTPDRGVLLSPSLVVRQSA